MCIYIQGIYVHICIYIMNIYPYIYMLYIYNTCEQYTNWAPFAHIHVYNIHIIIYVYIYIHMLCLNIPNIIYIYVFMVAGTKNNSQPAKGHMTHFYWILRWDSYVNPYFSPPVAVKLTW